MLGGGAGAPWCWWLFREDGASTASPEPQLLNSSGPVTLPLILVGVQQTTPNPRGLTNSSHFTSHSFCGSQVQERLSWGVLSRSLIRLPSDGGRSWNIKDLEPFLSLRVFSRASPGGLSEWDRLGFLTSWLPHGPFCSVGAWDPAQVFQGTGWKLHPPHFFLFFFFWPHCVACGILVPQPGIKPVPLQWKAPSPFMTQPRKSRSITSVTFCWLQVGHKPV